MDVAAMLSVGFSRMYRNPVVVFAGTEFAGADTVPGPELARRG
jgi:hypothetical protein